MTRLRIVARFENDESSALSGLVEGTLIAGVPVLEVRRFSPALELTSAAELVKRLADVRTPAVGVTGPRRIVAFTDGLLTVQSSYATADGPPRLSDVTVQWGSVVARGGTLVSALDHALAIPGDGGGGADWSSAKRWFERMEQARRRGDWTAFGRAYDALRRMLSVQ